MSTPSDAAAIALFKTWGRSWLLTSWEADHAVLGVEHHPRTAWIATWTGARRVATVKTAPVDRPPVGVAPFPDPRSEPLWSAETAEARRARTLRVCVCTRCEGAKQTTCEACGGSCEVPCGECSGSGRVRSTRSDRLIQCKRCKGNGARKCHSCSKGRVPCDTCAATGRLQAWVQVDEAAISEVHGAGDHTLKEAALKGGTQGTHEGIVWRGPTANVSPAANLVLTEHRHLRPEPRAEVRFTSLNLVRLDAVVSAVRYRLAATDATVHMVVASGRVFDEPAATTPLQVRRVLLPTTAFGAVAVGLASAQSYQSHPWYAHTLQSSLLPLVSVLLAFALTAALAISLLPGGARTRRFSSLASVSGALGAAFLALFSTGAPTFAHAEAATSQPAALAELRACVELGIDADKAGAALDQIALGAALASGDGGACWQTTRRTWSDPLVQATAEQHCFDLDIAAIDQAQKAGNYATTPGVIQAMPTTWQEHPEARLRRTRASSATFSRCVDHIDRACATTSLDELRRWGTPPDVAAAQQVADSITEPRLAPGWALLRHRGTSLHDRQELCETLEPLVALMSAVGTSRGAPSPAAFQQACDTVKVDIQAAADREAAANAKRAAAAARRAAAAERSWSSGGLMCNDGSMSPSCRCGGSHRGCCSWHGGVAGCAN